MSNEIHNDNPLIHYPHLCAVLSFHEAVKRVKKQIAARGGKLVEYSRKDIHILAEQYLAAHKAELYEATIARVQNDPEFRKLAWAETKRRGRYWVKPDTRSIKKPIATYPIEQMHMVLTIML